MEEGQPSSLTVALISDVFEGADSDERLRERLADVRAAGASLAVLPELPLDRWSPATQTARDDDAEPPGGPRHERLSTAAGAVGIGLIGGAIVRDPTDGRRRNTALIFDATGRHVASYAKVHLPEEPGFWETSHYVPGDRPPAVIDAFGLPIGVQICSDINRPEGCHLLGALGAVAVLAPRATEVETYPEWRIVFQANALTSTTWILSVNRPAPELGVPLGGPSIVVAPDGEVVVESTDPIVVAQLDLARVEQARRAYPGYLPVRSDLYAAGWSAVTDRDPMEGSA